MPCRPIQDGRRPTRRRCRGCRRRGRHLPRHQRAKTDEQELDHYRHQRQALVASKTAELELVNVAAATANIAKRAFLAKGLKRAVERQSLPSPLLGDPSRIQQALLNCVTPAVEFTETGPITMRTRPEDSASDSARLRFEVQGSGIGVDPETRARLFSTLVQADTSTTRKYGDTGLGLAVTRRLADLVGGNAGLDSPADRGSIFWFTVRRRKPVVAAAPASGPGPVNAEQVLRRDFERCRILLVEDNPANRALALILPESTGLLTDAADDGDVAVEMAANNDYALILMAVQMPKIKGVDATRSIRASVRRADVPIVAITPNAFAEDRKRCRAARLHLQAPQS